MSGFTPERPWIVIRALAAALCAVGCVAAAPSEGDPTGEASAPPLVKRVVLVTIDTLRADALGAYGGSARTPVLDVLAREGWLFEECMSASMLTNPSHASIMTSLYPRDHGVYDNESGIADGVHTLAAALRRHGLRTGAVIGFPHLNPEVANLGQGFEVVRPATRAERRADVTSREALSVIDAFPSEAPFFLWVHYVDPHSPYEPPATHPPRPEGARTPLKIARAAAPGFQRNNPWFKQVFAGAGTVEGLAARYRAEVESADAGLGILIEGLRERGLLSETALVVTSDHGENLGEHALYFHHGGLYRTTVHVPLIILAPGRAAQRVKSLVETVDIAPTVLELAGAPAWVPMRGLSLVSLASGGDTPRAYAFSEHMHAQLVSVRGNEGTLILHRKSSRQFPTYTFSAGRREVYLSPDERARVGEHAPQSVSLEAALTEFLGAGLRLAARPAVEQDKDALRALGYIE